MKTHTLGFILMATALLSHAVAAESKIAQMLSDVKSGDLIIGASSFFLSFLFTVMTHKDTNKVIANYSERYREMIQSAKSEKELEILTYFANTYRKDLTNKCKVAVKLKMPNSTDVYKAEQLIYFGLCQKWGNFVMDNIHMSHNLYDVDGAFDHYVMLVKKMLNWQRVNVKKAEKNPNTVDNKTEKLKLETAKDDSRLKKLIMFIENMNQRSKIEKFNLESYPLNFSLMKSFYKSHFKPTFKTLFETGKLNRYLAYIDDKETDMLDLLFSVKKDNIKDEKERMAAKLMVNMVDNFDDTTPNTMYRHYLPGFEQPLVIVKDYYPVKSF